MLDIMTIFWFFTQREDPLIDTNPIFAKFNAIPHEMEKYMVRIPTYVAVVVIFHYDVA